MTRTLLRKPSTWQLRTVTSLSGVSIGVWIWMPAPAGARARCGSTAPWQSSVTPDVEMSKPAV